MTLFDWTEFPCVTRKTEQCQGSMWATDATPLDFGFLLSWVQKVCAWCVQSPVSILPLTQSSCLLSPKELRVASALSLLCCSKGAGLGSVAPR